MTYRTKHHLTCHNKLNSHLLNQCHLSSVPVYAGLKQRSVKIYAPVIVIAVAICVSVYTFTGAFGYLTFNTHYCIASDILRNYCPGDVPIDVARGMLAVVMITSYPILVFCGRCVWYRTNYFVSFQPFYIVKAFHEKVHIQCELYLYTTRCGFSYCIAFCLKTLDGLYFVISLCRQDCSGQLTDDRFETVQAACLCAETTPQCAVKSGQRCLVLSLSPALHFRATNLLHHQLNWRSSCHVHLCLPRYVYHLRIKDTLFTHIYIYHWLVYFLQAWSCCPL